MAGLKQMRLLQRRGTAMHPAKGPLKVEIIPVGDWSKVARLMAAGGAAMKKAINNATRDEARDLAKQVRDGLTQQAPGGKPFTHRVRPTTLAYRRMHGARSRKTLLESRSMRDAIKAKQVARGANPTWTVGIQRGVAANRPGGKDLADVAERQERGYVVVLPKTKLKAFFAAMRAGGGPLGSRHKGKGHGVVVGNQIVISVPARPFFGPVFRAAKRGARERFLKRIRSHLPVDFS